MCAIVFALNPSIDVEWRVGDVQWEEKNTILGERRWPGGKGVNVARWLNFLGCETEIFLPVGGPNGRELSSGLKAEKLKFRPFPIREETRANTIVTTASGRQLRFNPAGPRLSNLERVELLEAFDKYCHKAGLVILSGSLPRGLPADFYSVLAKRAAGFGVKVVVDCDGSVFAAAVKARPFLVKPNEHELAQWHGSNLQGAADAIGAARKLAKATQGWVLVSRGAKGGLLVNADLAHTIRAQAPRVEVKNTVGAGDALLAGACAAIVGGLKPDDWLINGVAVGTAAVGQAGGKLPPVREIERLRRGIVLRSTSVTR